MKLNEIKKAIIEFFLSQPTHEKGIYDVTPDEFDTHFHNNPVYKKNLDTIITNGIIIKTRKGNKRILRLFQRDHSIEIRKILNYKRLGNLALQMQPPINMTKNLQPRFYEHADQNRRNGVYYFYTEKLDPDCWIVFARLNPRKEFYRYRLGSITDSESRLYRMWISTIDAWKSNGKQPIRRGMAEKLDQDSFGNNRQRGFAAFKLFSHAGWLRIPYGNGTSIYYEVVDDKAHHNRTKLSQFTNNILKRWGFDDK